MPLLCGNGFEATTIHEPLMGICDWLTQSPISLATIQNPKSKTQPHRLVSAIGVVHVSLLRNASRRTPPSLRLWLMNSGTTETRVVVRVLRRKREAKRAAHVPREAVPGAAAQHTGRAILL